MEVLNKVTDPIALGKLLWPSIRLYKQQEEVVYSVRDNVETYVKGGNSLGKDLVAAFTILWFFLTRYPCRIITTSADYSQLESVLWGEIRRLIQEAKYSLDALSGGPILVNYLKLRRIWKGKVCGLSYVTGRVAAKGEGMLGHHIPSPGDGIPRTLFVADEASGVDDVSYERARTWAQRMLIIGNPWPCTNFFYKGCKGGDILK